MSISFLPISPSYGVVVMIVLAFALYTILMMATKSLRRRQFARQHGCEPCVRYPHAFPYLGLDRIAEFKKAKDEYRISQWDANICREIGSYTYDLALPLFQHVIVTAEPANLKALAATQFEDFRTADRLKFVAPLIGKGIFTTDGEHWRHSRAMIRPNFSRAQVANIGTIETCLQDMIRLLPQDDVTAVDLQPLFFRLTFDTSTEFLFGESVHTLRGDVPGKPSGAAFALAYDTAILESILKVSRPPWVLRSEEDKRNCKIVRDFVQPYVDRALEYRRTWKGERETPTGQYTFLFELVKETTDPERLKNEVLNLLLAGRDTTASLLGSMFFQLAKRPDIWARLRAEVGEVNGRQPSFEELKSMKLLQWCMKETMRVNTIVPIILRNASKDTTLPVGGGKDRLSPIFVKAGQRIFGNVATMHLREDIWGADAALWNPDRWASARPSAWEYIPFYGGARVCLGQQFALTEAGYITARMAQMFSELTSHDHEPWQERFSVTCSSKQTYVSLTRA